MSHKHAYLSLILLLVLAGSVLGQDDPPILEYEATNPSPENEAVDVPVNTVLSWTLEENYPWNNVYFGTDPDNLEYHGHQTGTRFNPGQLEPNTTYYWEIVAEDDEGMTYPSGPVWSFTTGDRIIVPLDGWIFFSQDAGSSEALVEDGAVMLTYGSPANLSNVHRSFNQPQNWSGYDQLTITWNGKEGNWPAEIRIEVEDSDGNFSWSPTFYLDQKCVEGRQSRSIALNEFIHVTSGVVWNDIRKIVVHARGLDRNSIGTFYIKRIELMSTPETASGPNPLDGAKNVPMNATISWVPGSNAEVHDIYIGTDKDAVNNADISDETGIYRGHSSKSSLEFFSLEPETTYYWRIDSVDANGDIIKGQVWSFTTGNEEVVENFENYDDDIDAGTAIWQAWNDGLVNGTGSTVGYFESINGTFCETTIVHGGAQSMPLCFYNGFPPYFSETEYQFKSPRDWTEQGFTELSLWFRGYPPSVGSFSYDAATQTYTMTGSGTDIWDHDEFHFAYKRLTGNGSITARVDSVSNTNSWAKAGVMIRETLEPESAHAFVYVTPANGVAFLGRPSTGAASFNTAQGGITAPHWVKLESSIAGVFTVSHSTNGSTWVPVTGATPQNITMGDHVYIGLAVTSRNNAETCEAIFSNVTITGQVSSQWQNQDVGIISNDAEPLYVALVDSTGFEGRVYNPVPDILLTDKWTEWSFPLAEFSEVNLTSIDKMIIGVGNRDNPTPGGTGTIYIDDIRVYGPEPVEEDYGGVKAEYFNGMIPWGDPILSQIETAIDHDWGSSEVAGGLSDLVSARWRANLEVPITDTYTLSTNTDDGVALWLDGRLVIDNWIDHSATVDTATVDLIAGQYYMIEMQWYENGGDAVAQLSWESDTMERQIIPAGPLKLPLWPTSPTPRHREGSVDNATLLKWHTGDDATEHDVYFGDNADTVANADCDFTGQQGQQVQRVFSSSTGDKGRQAVTANVASDVYKGRQTETTYNPGLLEWGKTYYWRVDAVEADGTIRKGALWSFTTANLLHIENFEIYDDNFGGGTVIFFTWFDGLVNMSGSQAGHDFSFNGTFGDTTVFYDGGQSLPLYYNNNKTGSLKYSEVGRTFTPTLDMTVNGMDTLTLYVHGQTGNGIVPFYIGLQSGGNRKNVTYGDQMIVRSTSWVEVNIPLADFTGVDTGAVDAIYIGLGNPDAPTPGGSGLIYIDAIRATKTVP